MTESLCRLCLEKPVEVSGGKRRSTCVTCRTALRSARSGGNWIGRRLDLTCGMCLGTFRYVTQGKGRLPQYCSSACRSRVKKLWQNYRLRPADYHSLYDEQGGFCAMPGCVALLALLGVGAARVDHCHSTLRVRGLLCGRCNIALGHFEAVRARGAELYLEAVA